MGEREAITRKALEAIEHYTAQLPTALGLRVARALAVVGDTHGGPDGEDLRRRALDLQRRLEGPNEGD